MIANWWQSSLGSSVCHCQPHYRVIIWNITVECISSAHHHCCCYHGQHWFSWGSPAGGAGLAGRAWASITRGNVTTTTLPACPLPGTSRKWRSVCTAAQSASRCESKTGLQTLILIWGIKYIVAHKIHLFCSKNVLKNNNNFNRFHMLWIMNF